MMMAKGRKPQPAEVKAAKGNPGRRKNIVVSTEVAPLAGLNSPGDMTKAAALVWKELVPGMVAMGFLRQTDTVVFGIFCQTVADYRRAVKTIEKEGESYQVKSPHGSYIRQHPAVMQKERAARVIIQYAGEFGITPSARIKLQVGMAGQGIPPGGLFKKSDDEEKTASAHDAITFNIN